MARNSRDDLARWYRRRSESPGNSLDRIEGGESRQCILPARSDLWRSCRRDGRCDRIASRVADLKTLDEYVRNDAHRKTGARFAAVLTWRLELETRQAEPRRR